MNDQKTKEYKQLSFLMYAYFHETRHNIIEYLKATPAKKDTVGNIVEGIAVTQSFASKHIAILKDSKLLTLNKDGRLHWYELNKPLVERMEEILPELLEHVGEPVAG